MNMNYKLNSIVPWGRNLEEYKTMFSLSKEDLQKKTLGCGDGPSSFNAELTTLGGDVTSIDPIYEFTKEQLTKRIDEVAVEVMGMVRQLCIQEAPASHWGFRCMTDDVGL